MFSNFLFFSFFANVAFANSPDSVVNTSTDIPFQNGTEDIQDWSPEVEDKTDLPIINGEAGALEDYSMTGGMLMRTYFRTTIRHLCLFFNLDGS